LVIGSKIKLKKCKLSKNDKKTLTNEKYGYKIYATKTFRFKVLINYLNGGRYENYRNNWIRK